MRQTFEHEYFVTPATMRIGRRIVGRFGCARDAIQHYCQTPELFDGPRDVAVYLEGLAPRRGWMATYHAGGRYR